MRNKKNKLRSIALSGIIAASMILSGCGKKTSMWTFHLDDMEIDMAAPFSDTVETLIDDDLYVFDPFYCKFFDSDGEYSHQKAFSIQNERDEMILMMKFEEDDEQVIFFAISTEYGPFKKFESADKITRKTDDDELPKYFLFLDSYNKSTASIQDKLQNYCALVVDGQYKDLSSYVDDLPSKLTEEKFDEIYNMYQSLGRVVYRLVPELIYYSSLGYSEDFADTYEEDEALRNTVALLYAISDVYEEFKDGEIENFGTIAYTYSEGDMESCEYIIVSED